MSVTWVGGADAFSDTPLVLSYEGINEHGLHTFSTRAMTMIMDDKYLAHVLSHAELGPLHAEAMERAKA